MIYIFLSICCSVIVSILLKLARRYQIDVFQAITWNYSTAILLTWIIFKPTLSHLHDLPIVNYSLLGILLPLLFVIIALSVRYAGIVRTEVAQRLSLFIPVIAAFLVFGESINVIKIIGIVLGFVAIICSIQWGRGRTNGRKSVSGWLYLLIVFTGMGVIDVLFKQVAAFKSVPYTTSLFIIFSLAFILSLIRLIYMLVRKKLKFSWPHIFFGWILGIANFGNILFYIKAHQAISGNPSIVFSAMNIGVIVLGALVGLFIFKEKLSSLNKAGIGIAIIAIVIISFPEFFQKIFHLG